MAYGAPFQVAWNDGMLQLAPEIWSLKASAGDGRETAHQPPPSTHKMTVRNAIRMRLPIVTRPSGTVLPATDSGSATPSSPITWPSLRPDPMQIRRRLRYGGVVKQAQLLQPDQP